MKTIIAATDFSSISLNAVNYAAELAVSTNSELSIVHVCPLPISFSEIAVAAENIMDCTMTARERMNDLVGKLHAAKPDLSLSSEIFQGDIIDLLEEYCVKTRPFVVVVGSESRTAFERFLSGGGNTLKAVRRFSCPVIVVPPGSQFTRISKVGLACDLREVIDTIPAREIKSMVKQFGAEFHIIYSTRNYKAAVVPEVIEQSAWLQEMFDELKPEYHFLQGEEIGIELDDFSEKHQLDLLIIIPKKHGLAASIFHHSRSKDVVLHAHIPIMAIHE